MGLQAKGDPSPVGARVTPPQSVRDVLEDREELAGPVLAPALDERCCCRGWHLDVPLTALAVGVLKDLDPHHAADGESRVHSLQSCGERSHALPVLQAKLRHQARHRDVVVGELVLEPGDPVRQAGECLPQESAERVAAAASVPFGCGSSAGTMPLRGSCRRRSGSCGFARVLGSGGSASSPRGLRSCVLPAG